MSDEFRGHEWVREANAERLTLGVAHVRGRKQIALSLLEESENGGSIDYLAYFRSEEHAAKAIEVLRKFIRAVHVTGGESDAG